MAERVHPVDSAAQETLADVPLHIEKAKQQQQQQQHGLEGQHASIQVRSNGAPQRDVVYKVPPPLPADHPSKASTKSYRKPCCCCLAWLFSFLLLFAMALAIAVLIFYLILREQKFSVQQFATSRFNLSMASGSYFLSSEFLLSMETENPNKKLGLFYDDVQVSVSYKGTVVGHGAMEPFYQGHRAGTMLHAVVRGIDVPLGRAMGESVKQAMAAKGGTAMQVEARADVAPKLGFWKLRTHVTIRITCDVETSSSSSSQALSNNNKLQAESVTTIEQNLG